MIYTVSIRTDIPAFYWDWFLKRLDEKYVMVRNPYYKEKVSVYSLDKQWVDGFRFFSKDFSKVLQNREKLDYIINNFATDWQYTITGYDGFAEGNVPCVEDSIKTLINLSKIVGKDKIVWRYDPVFIVDGHYNLDYHKQAFKYIASRVAPYVRECGISEINVYAKVKHNMPEAKKLTTFEANEFANYMLDISKQYNLNIQTCPFVNGCFNNKGLDERECLTYSLFGKINNVNFKQPKRKMNGSGFGKWKCSCIASHDIGLYNTCLHGCRYCYANEIVEVNKIMDKYDVNSPLLCSHLKDDDIVQRAKHERFML